MTIQRSKIKKVLRELEVLAGCSIEKKGDFFSNVDYWFDLILKKFEKKHNKDINCVKVNSARNVEKIRVSDKSFRTNYYPIHVGSIKSFFPKVSSNGSAFKHEISILTPPIEFYKIVGGSMLLLEEFGPCYFDASGDLIEDLSTPYSKILFFLDVDVSDLIKFSSKYESGLVLLDRCLEPNYAHWLLDWMPRLMIKSSEEKLVLPRLKCDWQTDMLKNFSPESDHVYLENNDFVGFSKLIVPSCGGRKVVHPANKGHPRVIEFLRSKLNIGLGQAEIFPEVLVVYRKGSRELKNLNDVCASFIERGMSVCIVDCSTINVRKQWALFNSAKIIVGVHGAALASAVFMSQGSVLVEIFPASYGNPAFWIASSGLNISYISVTDVLEEDLDKKPRERGLRLTEDAISSFVRYSLDLLNNAECPYSE